MEQDKSLKTLFEQFADKAPELMSVGEVEQQIGHIRPVRIKSYKKIITVMGTISSIAIAAYMFLSQHGPTKINDQAAFRMKAPDIISPSSERNPDEKVVPEILLNDRILKPELPAADNRQRPFVPLLPEPVDVPAPFPFIVNETPAPLEGQDPVIPVVAVNEPYLRLSAEELFKLGIVGKDGGIFYEEIYNQKKPFRFSMVVDGKRLSVECNGGDRSILDNADKYPFLITDKYMTTAHSMLNRKELKDTIELFNNYRKYIPVIVSNGIADPDPMYPNELIFWFPKSDYIISRMPEWVQSGLANDPDAYAWDMKTGREYKAPLKMQTKMVKNEVLIRDQGKMNVFENSPVIQPDAALLSKLGFYYDKENNLCVTLKYKKFFYKIYKDGGTTYNLSDCPSADYFEKVQKKYAVPVPYYVSDSVCDAGSVLSLGTGNDGNENILQTLINRRHLMTPVKVRFSPLDTRYFWYMNNDKFLNALNPEQLKMAEAVMKDSLKNKRVIEMAGIATDHPVEPDLRAIYKLGQTSFDKVNAVTIDDKETQMLGYRVVDHDLQVFIPSREVNRDPRKAKTGGDSIDATVLTHTKRGTMIDDMRLDKRFSKIITPVYISDDLGKHTYISIFEDSTDSAPLSFDQLIPVLVKTGRSYNAVDLSDKAARPDYLLWYKVTPEFLALLPQAMKEEIQQEMKISKRDSSAEPALPCKYTDVCRQHKENILNVSVYPNPVSTTLNIDMQLKSLIACTISLADLSGKVVLQKQWIPGALNATTGIETSALESGIYYLYIHTGSGDLIVQKILVSRN